MGLKNDVLGSAEKQAISAYHVGSVWFTATTSEGVVGVRAVANAVQAQATRAATGGVKFFVAANQEGGEIQAVRGPGFSRIPTAVVQGSYAPSKLQSDAATWGRQLAAAGINLDFAPVLDVVPAGTESKNAPIGALEREYGSDPSAVAKHGVAFLRGMAAAGVIATAKHFPGLGRVVGNTDYVGGVADSVTTSSDPYLEPFRAAVAAGVPIVMVSLATYTQIDPDHLAALSPTMTRLLRVQLGFRGVIASDSLTANAVSSIPPAERAIDFLSAGGDLIVARTAPVIEAMIAGVSARAATDRVFSARVDDAVRRILITKERAALLPCS